MGFCGLRRSGTHKQRDLPHTWAVTHDMHDNRGQCSCMSVVHPYCWSDHSRECALWQRPSRSVLRTASRASKWFSLFCHVRAVCFSNAFPLCNIDKEGFLRSAPTAKWCTTCLPLDTFALVCVEYTKLRERHFDNSNARRCETKHPVDAQR